LPTSGGGGGGGGRTPRGRISATVQRRNAASSLRKVQSARPKITSSSSASSPSIMASSRDPRIVPSTDSLTAMQQRHEMEVLALTEKESSKEDERKKLLACVTGDERRTLLKMYKREREEMNNKIAALGHRQSQELMVRKKLPKNTIHRNVTGMQHKLTTPHATKSFCLCASHRTGRACKTSAAGWFLGVGHHPPPNRINAWSSEHR